MAQVYNSLLLFFKRFAPQLIILCIFLVAELIVWPVGEFPLNDDWSYTKSVLILLREGKIYIGNWGAMTLATNIVWGAMFCKMLGFSFFALRLSTLTMSVAGILVSYALVKKLSGGNRPAAFVAALTLTFNPYYFNLSNTFMTDVNFLTLSLCGLYLAVLYFEKRNYWLLLPILLVSSALVLLRQYGLFLPFCFFICTFFIGNNRLAHILLGAFILGASCVLLHYYEAYLMNQLQFWSEYKFIFHPHEDNQGLISRGLYFLPIRSGQMLVQVLFYAAPCAIACLLSLKWTSEKKILLYLCFAGAALTCFLLRNENPFYGNIVLNMHVGADTFYESLMLGAAGRTHTYSEGFYVVTRFLGLLFCFVSAFAGLSLLLKWFNSRRFIVPPLNVLMVVLMVMVYAGLVLVTESYIDRYHLPLISLCAILFAAHAGSINTRSWLLAPALVFLIYVSVAGTRDYFHVNRIKWDAYNKLVEVRQVPHRSVHGGFEPRCWDRGEYQWWVPIENLNNINYLIQYSPEQGFVPTEAYPFVRWFPYRRDTIFIFEREQKVAVDSIR